MKATCLDIIRNKPGILAGDIPKHNRNFLRELEKEGLVYTRPGEYGWHASELPKLPS